VPLRLGANWGYWPSDSVFDQNSISNYRDNLKSFFSQLQHQKAQRPKERGNMVCRCSPNSLVLIIGELVDLTSKIITLHFIGEAFLYSFFGGFFPSLSLTAHAR
jgi:hypothetical protein